MKKIISSFKNSCNGLKLAWLEDRSFRNSWMQFFAGTAIASFIAYETHLHIYTWLLLVGSLFPMVIVETINSSIEAVTDKASPEKHPLAKKAKDIASASVFIARIFAIICWIVVFIEEA